jgi:tetratricopeptide (TPR) repeat protein
MIQKKNAPIIASSDGLQVWRGALWLVVFGSILFFWPACLDRYLAPRFFFLSAALLVAVFWGSKDLKDRPPFTWNIFDLLLLGWYGLNLASVSWALSWSEGVFYAQKTLLLFGVYGLLRQALLQNEEMVRKTLGQITLWITGIVGLILIVQIGMAIAENGLDNETLYDYASGLFGNKSLAAEFLFFLLIFLGLFVAPTAKWVRKPLLLGGMVATLILLILILQVRTALAATIVGLSLYAAFRAFFESPFRSTFFRRIVPAGILGIGLLLALLAWKGQDSSILARLNPLNYLESDTANERRFVWYKTDLLNADHYWLGVGNGSWKFWMPSKNLKGGYRLEEKNIVFTRAHNDYLEIRSEMGMVGVIWFCALFAVAFLMAVWKLRQRLGVPQDTILAGIGLLGYCIIQYFDFPRERIEFQVILAILFAVIVHRSKFGEFSPTSAFRPFLRIGKYLFILGLVFNLIIGWERMRGELHNVRLLDAQEQGNWSKMASESILAENRFYEYTDAAIPIAWHEGVAWFQLGQFDKARIAFDRAYRLNPWSFQVINNYASALVKLNRYQESLPLFEKALSINPRYDEGKFNLSFVYYQMGDYTRSREWLTQVDTIARTANPEDREKNRKTLQRLEEFTKVLQEKRN